MKTPRKTFGFPLFMLGGFCAGACVAILASFVMSAQAGRFSYTGLFNLAIALGGLGTYIGHVVGAVRNKEAGFKPLGPLTSGVLYTGAAIVLVGTAVILAAAVWIRS